MARQRMFDHDEARRRYEAGETQAALAVEYGVSKTAIYVAVHPELKDRDRARSYKWLKEHRIPCADKCGTLIWPSTCSGLCRGCSARRRVESAPHGTENRYGHGCRCDACRAAAAQARRERRHADIEATRAYDRARRRVTRAAA
jgi:hypothetical protein